MARKHKPNDPAAADLRNAVPIPPRAQIERSVLLPGLRVRHDGWTSDRTQRFLDTLAHTGCVRDAARVAGVSNVAGYRLKKRFPLFSAAWDDALARAQQGLIAIAYQRAVQGKETVIIRNGAEYERRIAPSDAMLGLLVKRGDMVGSNVGSNNVMPIEDRITIAEWNDQWRFDEAGKKVKAEPEGAATERVMAKLMLMRRRMLGLADDSSTCANCGEPFATDDGEYLKTHSHTGLITRDDIPLHQA